MEKVRTEEATMFMFRNECDTVIARDVDDAWVVYAKHSNGSDADPVEWRAEIEPDDPLEQMPDDFRLSICVDEKGEITDDRANSISLTAREWVERQGRGFLCSTEF